MINFIKYSKIWLSLSAFFVAISIVLLLTFGLKLGIDFTGGSLMELNFDVRPEVASVSQKLAELGVQNPIIQKTGEEDLIIRMQFLSENEHQVVFNSLKETFGIDENRVHEERFETIGSSVSSHLRQRAVWSGIFVCLAIIFYIAYAFRKVSKPVASWKYGLISTIALLHDALIVMGIFAVLGYYLGVEIDIAFVVAILTIMGYSVNDTIVVFDRIRENLIRRKGNETFSDVVNNGLNQSLMRSINTAFTTLLVLLALYLFGGSTTQNFVLALIIGIIAGTYSSIFLASPLLVLAEKWKK